MFLSVINNILSTGVNTGNIKDGFTVLLLGMGIIFAALSIIMLFITIIGRVFKKADAKKSLLVSTADDNAQEAYISEPTISSEAAAANHNEIIAVITAAISAQSGKPANSFRVTGFKKR